MQDTNFTGHLAAFAGQQDMTNPVKSKTVGNYVIYDHTPGLCQLSLTIGPPGLYGRPHA